MSDISNRRLSKHSLLRRLTEEAKVAYVAERRLWKGSRNGDQQQYAPSKKMDDCWPKIAQALLSNGVFDCRTYMRVQFDACHARALCPEPRACYGPKAIARWRAYMADESGKLATEIALALRLNVDQFEQEMSRAVSLGASIGWREIDAVRFVLLDSRNKLSALFRYCMAAQRGLEVVADRYFEAAVQDYLFCRSQYDEIWEQAISSDLRRTADELLAGSVAALNGVH
jgi:hypothetical protein